VALIYVEKAFPNDGQIFQVISGLVTGFAGAFFMRVKPQSSRPEPASPGEKVTVTEQRSTAEPAGTENP
jgi:hypothetical protein